MPVIAVIFIVLLVGYCSLSGGERVTKGDLLDRDTADNVQNCAEDYIKLGSRDTPTQLWNMCLDVWGKKSRRPTDKVVKLIIERKGYDVFKNDKKP